MPTQRRSEFPTSSKLGKSENLWYNIFRNKGKAMSQGHSEKAHAAMVQTDGSNLVYCATIMYTCIYKGGNPKNAQLVPPFKFMIERMLFLTGSKWLSQAVHMNGIIPGAMNLVHAPVGSGKTTWAL